MLPDHRFLERRAPSDVDDQPRDEVAQIEALVEPVGERGEVVCDRDAIVSALESGQLAGYAGDVWFPQPAPADHPWRHMKNHGMTPHISGTSLNAQTRYAAGTREILECYFENRPIRDEYLIVQGGKLAGAGAHSYSEGNATKGSEDAERFKN